MLGVIKSRILLWLAFTCLKPKCYCIVTTLGTYAKIRGLMHVRSLSMHDDGGGSNSVGLPLTDFTFLYFIYFRLASYLFNSNVPSLFLWYYIITLLSPSPSFFFIGSLLSLFINFHSNIINLLKVNLRMILGKF